MESSPVVGGSGRPILTIGETIKRDLYLNGLFIA